MSKKKEYIFGKNKGSIEGLSDDRCNTVYMILSHFVYSLVIINNFVSHVVKIASSETQGQLVDRKGFPWAKVYTATVAIVVNFRPRKLSTD